MAKLSNRETKTIKEFVAHPRGIGYVLDYSDSSLYAMFKDAWNIDIDHEKYQMHGQSKGNRLVGFCLKEDANLVRRVLSQLHNEALDLDVENSQNVKKSVTSAFRRLLNSLDHCTIDQSTTLNLSEIHAKTVANNSVRNAQSILLVASAAIEELSAFQELVRSNNLLSVENPILRNKLLELLSALIEHLELLLTLIPDAGQLPTGQHTDVLASWTDRYVNAAIPKLQEYVSPEALGNTTVPIGVILLCGGVGSLLTGFSPIGFGAGSLVGKMITGEMKSGAAADKLKSSLSQEQ